MKPSRTPSGPSRRLPAFLLVAAAALLSGCAGGALGVASSWPGLASDGQLAFVAYHEAVYAIDLETGTLRWSYPAEPGRTRLFYAPPAVSPDGLVFVGDFLNQITALRAADGSPAWGPRQLSVANQRIIGAPAVAPQAVLVPSSDGRLYALEALTGEPLWEFPPAGSRPLVGGLWSAPVIAGDRVYVTALDHNLYVLDLATGQLLWNDPPTLAGAAADSPVLADGLLLIGTFGNQLQALDADRGSVEWSFAVDDWVWGSPAVSEGIAFFGDLSGVLHAISLASGSEAWRTPVGTAMSASPAVDRDRVFAVAENGVVTARNAANGAELWRQALQPELLSDPLLVGDLLLIASTSGDPLLSALVAESGATRWIFTPPERS